MKPACSVVLTTYERPRHLALALAGYARQTRRNFELIVADDGSGPETGELVRKFAASADFPVRHVRHARDGHRRTVILNRGIEAAETDYVLFSDGDCIPAARLLEIHLSARRASRLLMGGTVRVSPERTDRADAAWVATGAFERGATLGQRIGLSRRHLRNRWHILLRRQRRPHNLALNMSAWRRDLLGVNGFDERFRGWGNADGDLRERLKQVGVWPLSLWHRALVFHLHHPPEPSRADPSANRAYAHRACVVPFAELGIVKPRPSDPPRDRLPDAGQ